MGRSKQSEGFGKGKVTPVQVAFIVDRYLSDNNFSETRSLFRHEASSLIAKSPVQEAPKTLLSLGAILNEYIRLKEHKVLMEQERARLEQEKIRVHALLQGMQHVMNAYNASATLPAPVLPSASAKSLATPAGNSLSGHPVNSTPPVMPVSVSSNTIIEGPNFTSPITRSHPTTRKRASTEAHTDAPPAAKKTRNKIPSRKAANKGSENTPISDAAVGGLAVAQTSSSVQSLSHNCAADRSLVQASSVAKCLFNQPMMAPPSNSPAPKSSSQQIFSLSDRTVSILGVSSVANGSNNNTSQGITPTNCTVISTERVRVSPMKHMSYHSVERKHCISSSSPAKTPLQRPNKRDHVKGRLDFDASDAAVNLNKLISEEHSTPESEQADFFDLDLPELDAFGPNFSFSELLVDLDIDCEGTDSPLQSTPGNIDTVSGSSNELGDQNLGANNLMSEFSSTVKEVFSREDVDMQGQDTVTTMKSITKCIRILSPSKSLRRSTDQENCSARI